MVRLATHRYGLQFTRRSRSKRARAEQVDDAGPSSRPPPVSWLSSRIAAVLLQDYGTGHISATRVQLYAEASMEDIVACGGSPDAKIQIWQT